MAYVYNVCHRRDALQIYAVFTRTLIGSYPLFSAFYVQFVKKSHGRRQWWKWNVMILEMAKENVDELQFEYPRVWIRTIVVMVTSLDLSVFVPKSRNICNFYCKSLLLLLRKIKFFQTPFQLLATRRQSFTRRLLSTRVVRIMRIKIGSKKKLIHRKY